MDSSGLAATEVLRTCEEALACLEQETDPSRFKLFWVAAIASIRSVGHVLKNVDAVDHPKLAPAIARAYARWKEERDENHIFWEFIRRERNALLKEGRPGVHPMPHVVVANAEFSYECDFDVFAPMLDNPFFGDDCRDVLGMAISWWREQLEIICKGAET